MNEHMTIDAYIRKRVRMHRLKAYVQQVFLLCLIAALLCIVSYGIAIRFQ